MRRSCFVPEQKPDIPILSLAQYSYSSELDIQHDYRLGNQ